MIRPVRLEEAEDVARLRREAPADAPLCFGSSAEDDFVSTADGVREHLRRGSDAVVFGAFAPALVGSLRGELRSDERCDPIAWHRPQPGFAALVERLERAGARRRKENETEGDSFTFEDPSGNRFEIHATTLADRIRRGRETRGEGVVWYE